MIQLTKEYWNKFQPDGILFEQLIGDLLSFEYPGHTFKKTKQTHDGSRDWELHIPLPHDLSADIWFECKFHKEKLASEKIAMTLVMAYIESAKQIVFFSYSPVNRGFVKKISLFSERSGIPVFIYDDFTLEELIFKHWEQLDILKYFPDFTQKESLLIPGQLSASCEVYRNGNIIACHTRKNPPVIRFNDELRIRLTLFNRSLNDTCSVTVSVKEDSKSSFIFCGREFIDAKSERTIQVPNNGIVSFSFFLKLKSFAPLISLPELVLTWEKGRRVIYPGIISGQWLAETMLIGQDFYSMLNMQNEFMRSGTLTVSQIIGHSGVGKSRLIHEIAAQGRAMGKQIFHLDNDLHTNNYMSFVRQLVSHLEGLPVLPDKRDIYISGNSKTDKSRAIRLLYDETYLPQVSAEELAQYLLQKIKSQEIWILLDNVQWMDEPSLELLKVLISRAGISSESGIVLAFNQDFLYSGTPADRLMRTILSCASQRPDRYDSKEIKGFTYTEAINYLRECLTYQEGKTADALDYENVLKRIADHCGTQPFYLQNMLIYLNQCHVLERTAGTSFLIVDIPAFWKHVQEIPKSVSALLERRIKKAAEYFKSAGQGELFESVCTILSICGSLPSNLCRELFGTFPIKRELMEIGLISEAYGGSISFYHQYFEQYFQQIYPLEQLPSCLLEQFLAAVRKRQMRKSLIDPYYLVKYTLGTCDETLLLEIMERLISWEVPPRFSRAIKVAISNQLANNSDNLPSRLVAECYYAICFMTANREGMQEACYFYEKCFRDLLSGKEQYIKHRDILFPLIREYLLSLGNLNRNRDALKKADELLSHQTSVYEYCTIQEIACISNYAIGKTAESERAVKAALKRADRNGKEYILLTQEYGKLFYFHLNAYQYKKEICEKWDLAFNLYQKKWRQYLNADDTSSLQMEISTHLNSGISDIMQGRYEQAEKKMACLTGYIDHTKMPFYEIKIRLYRALILLLRDFLQRRPGQSYDEIMLLLNQACDHCVIYYNMQDYPNCFYLRASAQLYAGHYSEAVDSYIKTCMVLQAAIDNSDEESIWSYFYEDMALRFNQLGQDFPKSLLNGICSVRIRNRVKQLMLHPIPEEAILTCNRSPIILPGENWGLPKI